MALIMAAKDLGDLILGWQLITSLPVIVGVAVLAGRLLGVRRSLGQAIASGVAGWIAGGGLSLVVARSEHGAGFSRNLWLFSIFFAMSASVWIDFLAKPGALARAQSGLRTLPRPLNALRRKRERLSRYVQISRIAARHGLGPSLGISSPGPSDDGLGGATGAEGRAPVALRLRRALEDGGGMFVKLGQVLSTRSDLLPADIISELTRLQDHVTPASQSSVQELVEGELGAAVDVVFAEFDWQPLAAASIGQVYRARLHDGQAVVVKVQRPGIASAVERDIEVLHELAGSVENRAPWAKDYHVQELAHEFTDRLREELDFRIEARNTTEIAGRVDTTARVRIPHVFDEFSTARILVLEWLEGVSVRQLDRIDALGVDRAELADRLLRCCLQQMLVDGHFHADPHPGNVMVLNDGDLGLIDFGAAGRLDPLEQSSLRAIIVAVARRDPALMRQAVLEVATLRRGFDDDLLERALARFMGRNLGPGASPSAAMFNELLQLFFSFGISLPPEFATFFRAMVTLEGTLTTLSPGYLVIDEAQRIGVEWAAEQLTPGSLEELARNELVSLAPLLRRLPRHLDRLATIAERGDLRAHVSLFSGSEDVRVLTRLVNRLVLAFLGGAVGLISVLLLGVPGGPTFTGTTSLYQFFGYFGLFCGTVLVLRVLVAILHDGVN